MYKFIFFAALLLVNCTSPKTRLTNPVDQLSELEVQEKYQELLDRIHSKTKTMKADALPDYLENCLTDSIFNYWYETPWDFNGTTEQPRKGKIACGYFVTTTLKHLGLNIDRVYLAQQASSVLIKEVCDESSIKTFTNGNFKKMIDYVNKYNGNVFIAGLDYHVGYIVKEGNDLYFIHSRGVGSDRKVVKEKYDEAGLLVNSQYHMIGHVNFRNWIKGLQKNE